jgi:hypothetical protein
VRNTLLVASALLVVACGDDSPADDDAGATIDADVSAIDGAVIDARSGPCSEGSGTGALSNALGADYLVGDPTNGTDVACAVSGGVGPYSCELYEGPGEGSVPSGVVQDDSDPSGCTLSGGVDPVDDNPGVYGFIVVVSDDNGDEIEIPVVYEGADCDTANVTMTPTSTDVLVHEEGTAQTWTVEATDVAGVDVGPPDGCDQCANMSLLTRAPLSIKLDLECANDGDICSECNDCFAGSCPGPFTMTRPVELATHGPLRIDGERAWATLEITATYSGASLDPCGDTRWACHIEVLETAVSE